MPVNRQSVWMVEAKRERWSGGSLWTKRAGIVYFTEEQANRVAADKCNKCNFYARLMDLGTPQVVEYSLIRR